MKRHPFILSMSLTLGILASSLIPGRAFAAEIKPSDAQQTAAEVTSVNVKETDTENDSEGQNTYDATELNCVWQYENGNAYWYEHGIRQGTMSDPKGVRWKNDPPSVNRGREIYDGSSDAWYWLDSAYGGAKAVSKEVFMPYVYQNEASMSDAERVANAQTSDPGMQDYVLQLMRTGTGKWVRYDENGHMFKGWSTITSANCGNRPDQIGNTYYYDVKTGAMAKGSFTIDDQSYTFDETSGVLKKGRKPSNPKDNSENPKGTPGKKEDADQFSLSDVPSYSSSPYLAVHDNVPYFSRSDLTTKPFEKYSNLDSLGRCGVAYANICKAIMPTEERGEIGMIRPSGWHTVKYNGIDGNYLYNRCHLIGYQLAGENANEKNLVTGTRYLNTKGMLPFENMVADYVKETNHHVLYRVTPIFEGNNLLASGVLMEAESVEDKGAGIQFCVYCYNVQPGITINYADGTSSGPEFTGSGNQQSQPDKPADQPNISTPATPSTQQEQGTEAYYIGNRNSKVFHRPSCSSVRRMKEKNKVTFGKRSDAVAAHYRPCKICNP